MKKAKGIVRILVTLVVIAIVVVAIVTMQSRHCEKVQVRIQYNGENPTVSSEDVIALLEEENIPILGEELKEIDAATISKVIEKNPFVRKTNKVLTAGTTLIIDISLRNLLVHIYPEKGEQFFIDEEGFLLPYSSKVKENLIVANGNIEHSYKAGHYLDTAKNRLNDIYSIAKILSAEDFYSAQFRQIYINSNQEIELIPMVGKQIVLVGDGQNIQEKLFNLKETYKNALVYKGIDQYAQLDLRFKNRVIAKKR